VAVTAAAAATVVAVAAAATAAATVVATVGNSTQLQDTFNKKRPGVRSGPFVF
jgi:hypothetical protein